MPTPTFPTLPGVQITCHRRPIYSTGIQTSASGKEMRASWWSTPRYEYDLSFDILRDDGGSFAEMGTLLTFIDSVAGSFGAFNFTDPFSGATVLCRFKQDAFDFIRIVNQKWELRTLTLISLK